MNKNAPGLSFPHTSTLTRTAWRDIDEGIEHAIAKGGRQPTCSAGCHYCCYEKVSASPNEVFELAEHIRETWSTAAQSALRSRLRSAAVYGSYRPEDYFAAQVSCPLLAEDGRCSVYEARPINCRRCHSYSLVEACKSHAPQVVLNNLVMSAANRDRARMKNDFAVPSLQSDSVVFVVAPLKALEDSSLRDRWLEGESVFETWVDPQTTPAIDD